MTIELSCINFIVCKKIIEKKYPGGWEQCLKDHEGGPVWFDEHLFRDGAMNPMDIGMMIDRWKSMGFRPRRKRDGVDKWADICIVDSFGGPTLPCRWIDVENGLAKLKGASWE